MPVIALLLETLFGVPSSRVELSDDLSADWGIDRRERRRFEQEFVKRFPDCDREPLRQCVTVGDFVRYAV